MFSGLDDCDGSGSPEVVPLALDTLRIQLVVLGVELEGYIALFFVGHHQIQVPTTSTADESRHARIESQNKHRDEAFLMKALTA
jgi:hypothetical protein